MTTALATVDGEIVDEIPQQPVTLFGTTDPAAVVERASNLATALADVISRKNLYKRIGNRDHVLVEGWTLLGSMLGVFAEVEWTHQLENGWEARAVARTLRGNVVGAAEAMCTRSESTWKNRDDYAIRSMAQTRAVSKALRLPLGYIIELAGYSATPAEELDSGVEHREDQPRQARPAESPLDGLPRTRGEAQQAIAHAAHARGWNLPKVDELAKSIGIKRGDATMEQLLDLLHRIELPGEQDTAPAGLPTPATTPAEPQESVSEPQASGGQEASGSGDAPAPPAELTVDDIMEAAGPGAELLPPKPGTDAYKALPSGTERSQAKAYWDKVAA